MSEKRSSLLGGVAILSVAGILSKIIGMFFRIPLANMIGSGGMGVYQKVYPTYTLLLTISTAGIPVAISRLVSESVALRRDHEAKAVLRTALLLLAAIGGVLTLALMAVSGPLSRIMGTAEASLGFVAIAPSIFLVSVMSVFRGYMQGRSQMTPTAISQLIEQVAKVVISLRLASIGFERGIGYAAAGALLGITIGEGLAALYMAFEYFRRRRAFAARVAEDETAAPGFLALARQMIRIAVPITIGSIIVPVSGFIDSAMITNRLIAAGFDSETATSLFGLQNGNALSIVNVVTVLATAVCIGLVPYISAARAEGRDGDMRRTCVFGLRLGSLIGMPSAVGMSMLATPIVALLYPDYPAHEIIATGEILSISALTIFFFTQVQATTGILQGAGQQKIPMYSLVIGVFFKAILNYILIAIPSINIYGAPIASLVCYTISMVINAAYITRRLGVKMDLGGILLRPAIATAGMGAAVLLLMQLLDMERRFSALIAVAIGGIVYVALIFAVGAIRREDMDQLPGGGKVEKLMIRVGVWHK